MRTRKSHGRLRYPQGDPPKIRGWLSVEICILPRTHRMSMTLSRTEARSDDNFCSRKYLHPYTRWNSCRNMSLHGKWLHEWSCNLWNRKTFISLHRGDLYISDCRHYHCIYHSSYSLMQKIISPLLSLAAWGVFGFWLAISDMLSPYRVQGFFDIFWAWDPTLLFVMIGALSISLIGHYFFDKHTKPLFGEKWHFPWEKKWTIDMKLVTWSVLFGIGWWLAGLCPGPAIGGIIYMAPETIIFLISMIISMSLYKFTHR